MSSNSNSSANRMWGGHYARGPAEIMARINQSIGVDKRLWREDIEGSKAHCTMLVAQKILSAEDGGKILGGLDAIAREIESGTFVFKDALEDIHMNVEARLAELIGPAAGRLHTARSRNDQVALDFRLWVREAVDGTIEQIQTLQRALLAKAEAEADTLIPGFTHLQSAQPTTFGHHLSVDAMVELIAAFEDGLVLETGDRVASADYVRRMRETPGLPAAVRRLGVGDKAEPAVVASAVELVLEGLHLARRVNKDRSGAETVYRR